MRLKTIEFSLEKTTPLEPLTHDEADRYANVKPAARCVIELDRDSEEAEAWQIARDTCFDQLVAFHTDLIAAIRERDG